MKRRSLLAVPFLLSTNPAWAAPAKPVAKPRPMLIALDPGHGGAQYELGRLLLERREFAAAADHFRAALRAMPDSARAHNDLGVALASKGARDEAIDQFQQALRLQPDFPAARRNLEMALRRQSRETGR